MTLIGFLVLFPLVAAALLAVVKGNGARKGIVYVSAAAIAVASIAFAALNLGSSHQLITYSSAVVDTICTGIGVIIAIIILGFAIKYKNILAGVLALIQVVGALAFELGMAHGIQVTAGLVVDPLIILMALIIGIIGSGICVYALGYMEDFQHHEPEGAKDRRPYFFALMFIFLSAMFLIVCSNNMLWMFTGWEVTTVCSFLLIGFTKTEEAIRNSFRQIIMNLLGGIAFLVGMYFTVVNFNTLSFDAFLAFGVANPNLVAIPAICLAFAGLTKAAQMPFHTWLLGAMVAPTPTSALLHSSTMVKAGVFLLVKLAPIFAVCLSASTMVILVGGFTFLFCSLMAISQSNAKRVLAYSTIANLGLITACAGVGTAEAIWAATFLILFHAAAKSLLFLCVGTAEHHIGSRDIESMDLLFERMPHLARLMMIGIMCMFIAPLGMLMAKWGALVSFAETKNIVLLLILAFGSAATFMFWAKWIGKLAGIAQSTENVEKTVHKSEWIALLLMTTLIFICCVLMPVISEYIIEPYIASAGIVSVIASQALTDDNMVIAAILTVLVFIVLIAGPGRSKARKVDVYLAGISVDNEKREFTNALSGVSAATARNWYLADWFGEAKLNGFSTIFCTVLIIACFVMSVLSPLGF